MQQLQRVAIYARVSSEQRTGEDTIASQLAALQARVSSDGQVLPAEQRFVDDGYSGATLVRPALERLRDVAAAGGLDRVYVHSPDRLAKRSARLRAAGVDCGYSAPRNPRPRRSRLRRRALRMSRARTMRVRVRLWISRQ